MKASLPRKKVPSKVARSQAAGWPDVHPYSSTERWLAHESEGVANTAALYPISEVAPLVGLQPAFIKRALGHSGKLSQADVASLLQLDAMSETFVPRSRILSYIQAGLAAKQAPSTLDVQSTQRTVIVGDAHDLIRRLPDLSIDCVVTSTPYWAVRLYGTPKDVKWADGEICPFGHEQTPEGFVRHSVELLYCLKSKLKATGSIWWNIGDTYHTRTQVRGNAYETIKAMKGLDKRKWTEHECRRFSGGHSYLIDGAQCLIPQQIAERASRIGYLVRSMITWSKEDSTPEPALSRVTKSLEYVLHLSRVRNPTFEKGAFRTLPPELGGRNPAGERDQVTDVWNLRTSDGRDGHGAQFPLSLPARCIALSTKAGDLVLDPFAGSATTGVAAQKLGRRFLGFEISREYARLAEKRLSATILQ